QTQRVANRFPYSPNTQSLFRPVSTTPSHSAGLQEIPASFSYRAERQEISAHIPPGNRTPLRQMSLQSRFHSVKKKNPARYQIPLDKEHPQASAFSCLEESARTQLRCNPVHRSQPEPAQQALAGHSVLRSWSFPELPDTFRLLSILLPPRI